MAAKPDLIARALLKHMETHDLSVTEIAARAQFSRANLSGWLTGRRTITMDTLIKVLDAIDRLDEVRKTIAK